MEMAVDVPNSEARGLHGLTVKQTQRAPSAKRTKKTSPGEFTRRGLLSSFCAGSALGLLDGQPMQSPRFRIWDIHSHLHSVPGDIPEKRMEVLIRCSDRLGLERRI